MNTATGTSNSITSLPVGALGNGAEAYCIGNASTYRYVSTSTQTTIGDTFLVPLSGGGCWFKQGAQADFSAAFTLLAAGFSSVSFADQNWAPLPFSAGFYQSAASTNFWSMNGTTGVVTYAGPSKTFLVLGSLSLASVAPPDQEVQFDLTQNGANLGAATVTTTAVQGAAPGTLGSISLGHHAIITGLPGSTLQHMLRNLTASSNLFILRYQIQIISP